jgi:hypothetical protein
MKMILIAAALAAATGAHAEQLSQGEVCAAWANNAVIGARHALESHSRKIIPISEEQFKELLVHGQLWDVNGIPVLADDYRTDADKKFVEQSIYCGFDEAQHLDADQRRQFMTVAQAHFADTCEHMDVEYGGTQ